MKCLLLIFAFVSLVAAQLGNECTVSADCGLTRDNKICVDGKCIQLVPFHPVHRPVSYHGIVGRSRSLQPPCEIPGMCGGFSSHGRPSHSHNKFPACPPCEAIGAVCKGGICVKDYASVGRDFYATPCPVPCEKFGQVCVRGVCQ